LLINKNGIEAVNGKFVNATVDGSFSGRLTREGHLLVHNGHSFAVAGGVLADIYNFFESIGINYEPDNTYIPCHGYINYKPAGTIGSYYQTAYARKAYDGVRYRYDIVAMVSPIVNTYPLNPSPNFFWTFPSVLDIYSTSQAEIGETQFIVL